MFEHPTFNALLLRQFALPLKALHKAGFVHNNLSPLSYRMKYFLKEHPFEIPFNIKLDNFEDVSVEGESYIPKNPLYTDKHQFESEIASFKSVIFSLGQIFSVVLQGLPFERADVYSKKFLRKITAYFEGKNFQKKLNINVPRDGGV